MLLLAYYPNDLGKLNSFRLHMRNLEHPEYIRRSYNRDNWKLSFPIPNYIDHYLTCNSDFYLFILRKYDSLLRNSGLRKKIDHNAKLLSRYADNNKDWISTKLALQKIYWLSEKYNIITAMVIIPSFHEVEEYKLKYIHDKVSRYASSEGYNNVIDLLPYFEGHKNEKFIVSKVDTHPNAKAHKIMAEKTYNYLHNNVMNGM